jgi:hypothetical protein
LINKLRIALQTIQQLKTKFVFDTESVLKDFGNFKSLSEDQINWKPAFDSWSIAECIDHLIVTNKLYLNEIEKQFAMKQIKIEYSRSEVKHKWLSKFIIKAVDPANIKKIKTLPVFMPSMSKYRKDIFDNFYEVQTNLVNIISFAKDFDLNKYVMSSPAAKIIKENFCGVLEIIRLHDRRHFNQAEKLINHPNFPKN